MCSFFFCCSCCCFSSWLAPSVHRKYQHKRLDNNKILQALNQSFGNLLLFCFNFPQQSHVRSRPFSQTRRRGRSLLPAVLMYKQISSKFLKVLFQSHGGFHVPWASHHSLLSCVSWRLHRPYRKQRKNSPSAQSNSDLPPTFVPPFRSLWAAPALRAGPARLPAARERGRAGGSGPRRREVMSKQVIIMRCALQKLAQRSPGAPSTPLSASRYSRESSSRTCSKSTAKKEKPRWDALPTGKRMTRRLGPEAAAPAPGGLSTAVPLTLCSSQVGNRTLCYFTTVLGPSILILTLDPGDI